MHSYDRIGTTLAETWHIERQLGTGGMATVYAARHGRNGRQVAVKVLHIEASRAPEIVRRFIREGYLTNTVNHPGVAQVFDDGVTSDGCAFLVMDLLEGQSLETSRRARGGRLPVPEALALVRDVLGVLAASHEQGITHRDVKPDNVFLTCDGQVKLLDFGIASMTTSGSGANTGVGWGTPQFMAPEQLRGTASCGPRVDVWAVAVMFFKLVTGSYPFEVVSLTQLVEAQRTKPSMLDRLLPDVSPRVAEVFHRAFTFDPEGRFDDAGEMARALEEAESMCCSTTMVLATVPRIVIARPFADVRTSVAPLADPRSAAVRAPRERRSQPTPAPAKRHVVLGFLALSIASLICSAAYVIRVSINDVTTMSPQATYAAGERTVR